jgi:hypothetical protein
VSKVERSNPLKFRLFGPVAALTGESSTVSLRHGRQTRARFQFIAVYVEVGDTVRLAHFQSTALHD